MSNFILNEIVSGCSWLKLQQKQFWILFLLLRIIRLFIGRMKLIGFYFFFVSFVSAMNGRGHCDAIPVKIWSACRQRFPPATVRWPSIRRRWRCRRTWQRGRRWRGAWSAGWSWNGAAAFGTCALTSPCFRWTLRRTSSTARSSWPATCGWTAADLRRRSCRCRTTPSTPSFGCTEKTSSTTAEAIQTAA